MFENGCASDVGRLQKHHNKRQFIPISLALYQAIVKANNPGFLTVFRASATILSHVFAVKPNTFL